MPQKGWQKSIANGKEISIMLWSDLDRMGRFLDPWRDFEQMSRALYRIDGNSTVEFPAVNVWVSGDKAVVTTEIPGVDSDELEITAVKDTLTLRGMRKMEELREDDIYHRRERWSGQFTKTLQLPFAVEAGKVEARFARGVLYVTLPRAEADKPRKISIKSE